MKFYNRQDELNLLNRLDQQAMNNGIMTVLTGRRRVGKTMLALHHAHKYISDHRFLYLFIGRKEEQILAQELLEDIKEGFQTFSNQQNIPLIGQVRSFKEIFSLLLELARTQKLTVIIDEFQEFFHINPSVYSDVQKLWDLNKHKTKLHVIFIGSVYSLMYKIFQNDKQPLFGRQDRLLHLRPFSINTLREILQDNKLLKEETLFHYFVITGGLPKYLDILTADRAKNTNDIFNLIYQKDSLFLTEGKNLLIEEFGKEYVTYFSILELMSQGKTSRREIESVLEKDIGGYLGRLEQDYGIIERHRPIHSTIHTKNQKYKIVDNFLTFWFRFIYRYRTAIEMENFAYVRKIIDRDYATYCGFLLERFFGKLLAETGQFNKIGGYWEKDNQNEIDIVAINDFDKKILIVETKLNKDRIRLQELKHKAEPLLKHYPDYAPTYLGLGLQDVLNVNELIQLI